MHIHNVIFVSHCVFSASWMAPAHPRTGSLPASKSSTLQQPGTPQANSLTGPTASPGMALEKALSKEVRNSWNQWHH